MRRRIWSAVTLVAVASLAVGVGMAVAAPKKKSTAKHAVKAITLNCNVSLTTEPPPGSNTVDQPASEGSQYGPIHCGPATFGNGVEGDAFTVPDSGDTVGNYTQYFNAGTVKGSFDLTPDEQPSPFETGSFQAQTWTGTVTVTGGTGVYKGIKGLPGKNNVGSMKCNSADSVHLSCKEKIKVTLPPAK